MKKNQDRSYTREILLATLITTAGFVAALFINAPEQSALELTLNNIALVFLGVASTIGWTWLIAKFENANKDNN